MANPQESLVDIVRQDKFLTLKDHEILDLCKKAFAAELDHLKNASPTVESGATEKLHSTPSQRVFGEDFHEVNRTLTSMLAIKWILNDEYEMFTSGQNKTTKLSEYSFWSLQELFRDGLTSPDDLYALIVALVIDDIGKDKALAVEVGMRDKNHGEVLLKAAEMRRVPALETIPDPASREHVIQSLRIGSKLDISQIVQAETVPYSLKVLDHSQGLQAAFYIKAMVTMLDVGGAAAHRDPRGCVVMTQSVFGRYIYVIRKLDMYRLMENPDWLQCYDRYLDSRAYLQEGWCRSLPTKASEKRALLRLFGMGRVETEAIADQFVKAFKNLSIPTRRRLVDGLSVNGIQDGTAIVPYYAPGLLSEVLRDAPEEKLVHRLQSFMWFLAEIYNGSKPQPGEPGALEERDLSYMQALIKSPEFQEDPTILPTAERDKQA
ncbi:hypothetical protein BDV26DRAFT_87115 [Aspergillus bertholletiae]|uniref:Uncharacterized protein n=1 Tax=Aspergillus bertholletiae TaxID=1226010 RepID=A0A5N7ASD5_9EURO|nr:hypothetical protein BDV26DRAFT_87115 [Aspergillus bertholletiae]